MAESYVIDLTSAPQRSLQPAEILVRHAQQLKYTPNVARCWTTPETRETCVRLLLDVSSALNMTRDAYHVAVNFFNRAICSKPLKDLDLDLLCCSCLTLASRVQDIAAVNYEVLVRFFNLPSRDSILQSEKHLANALKYQFHPSTPLEWIRIWGTDLLCHCIQRQHDVGTAATFLSSKMVLNILMILDLFTLNMGSLSSTPSQLVLACMYILTDNLPTHMASHVRHAIQEVAVMRVDLEDITQCTFFNVLRSIWMEYSDLELSELPPGIHADLCLPETALYTIQANYQALPQPVFHELVSTN